LSYNPILELFDGALSHLFTERLQGRFEPDYAEAREITRHHVDIADAIIHRNGAAASRLMAEHMRAYLNSAYTQYSTRLDDVLDWR
jgi:DNA-binding FadR family transcriptional regulator